MRANRITLAPSVDPISIGDGRSAIQNRLRRLPANNRRTSR